MEIQQLIEDGLLIRQDDGKFKIEPTLRKQLMADGVLSGWFEGVVNDDIDYKLKEIRAQAEDRPAANRQSFYIAELDKLSISCNNNPWNQVYKSSFGDLEDYLNCVLSKESFTERDIGSFIERNPEKVKIPLPFIMEKPFKLYRDKKILAAMEGLIENEGNPAGETKIRARDKIKWLAGCAELGELFVQLHRMGWIEEIKPSMVDKLFYVDGTKPEAHCILDYLRPGRSNRSTEKPYPKIFGKKYKPQFENLKKRSD